MTADHTVAEAGYQERDDCAEAVEAARAEAWDEGAEFMAAQEGIAPDRDRNPYREATP